jgi:hypothetical protein
VTGGNLTLSKTFTLQLTMTQASGGGAWTAAGFGTETTTQDDPINNSNNSGFFCINNGGAIAIYYVTSGGVQNNIYYTGSNPGTNIVDLKITMGAMTDTLSASINAITVATADVGPLEPMSQVFIGDAINTSGAFSDFSVFEDVPEPSTYAMLFGGLGVLVLVSRFRRRLAA